MITGKNLGQLVKAARQSKKLTQSELAKSIEISTRHLQYVERGEKMPGYDLLCKLIHKLDLPSEQLIQSPKLSGTHKHFELINWLYQLNEQNFDVVYLTANALLHLQTTFK